MFGPFLVLDSFASMLFCCVVVVAFLFGLLLLQGTFSQTFGLFWLHVPGPRPYEAKLRGRELNPGLPRDRRKY